MDNMTKKIHSICGNTPTYLEYYKAFLAAFREFHPQSTAPKNTLIEMFYDDYLIGLPSPSY